MSNATKVFAGFLLGVITCLLISYGFYLARYSYITMDMMKGNPVLVGPLMQVGVISNIIWIFLLNRWDKPNLLRGVGFAMILLVIVVIYLKFKFS